MGVEEYTLEGENFVSKSLDVKDVVVTIISQGDKIVDVQAEFRGAHQIWEKIKAEGLFAYKEEICGPIMGFGFNRRKEYIFSVGLQPDQTTILSILAETPASALETLLKAEHNPAFVDLKSYRLLSVMQQVSSKTQWGMTTTYYKELED